MSSSRSRMPNTTSLLRGKETSLHRRPIGSFPLSSMSTMKPFFSSVAWFSRTISSSTAVRSRVLGWTRRWFCTTVSAWRRSKLIFSSEACWSMMKSSSLEEELVGPAPVSSKSSSEDRVASMKPRLNWPMIRILAKSSLVTVKDKRSSAVSCDIPGSSASIVLEMSLVCDRRLSRNVSI